MGPQIDIGNVYNLNNSQSLPEITKAQTTVNKPLLPINSRQYS